LGLEIALIQTTEMHSEWNFKSFQDLRQLRDMPEGVGDITNFLNMSKIAGNSMTEKQIANKRFPADQEFIWKNIPGSNANTTITNELLKDFAFLGPDLKVILQYNGLRVEIEVGVGRMTLQ